MKQSGIMSLVHTIGNTEIVIAAELDKVKKEIGQPKINWFVKKTIALKVIKYSKTYKISKRQSWLMLCNLKSHIRRSGSLFRDRTFLAPLPYLPGPFIISTLSKLTEIML